MGTEPGVRQFGEGVHFLRVQFEIEDVQVLADSLPMNRFHEGEGPALDAPAQQHLGGGFAMGLGNLYDNRVSKQVPAPQRAPGFYQDVIFPA